VGVAAAAEEPYDAVPAPVAAFLEHDGFDVRAFKPRQVKAEDVEAAARIVTIDCKAESVPASNPALERWDDVPKVSVDLDASVAAIRLHVEALAAELRGRR
jgi:protein-tyrosine-phosphatase